MKEKKNIQGGIYEGERALFMLKDAFIVGATFQNGESPLKESRDLVLRNVAFKWKYPIWYANNIDCDSCRLDFTARSGIWYTKNIKMRNCKMIAPKTFRYSSYITLDTCSFPHASETLWKCDHVFINNCDFKGDYFGMNSSDIEVNHIRMDGNYMFDGAKNIVVRDSILNSKDAFWNTENATLINCKIIGEYLGWNSRNLTFINCEISSLQALCYIDGLKLINCKLLDSTLTLEYCKNIDAEIIDVVDSIKNPTSGIVKVKGINNLIIDENSLDKERKNVKIILL